MIMRRPVSGTTDQPAALARFTGAAETAAGDVIRSYSTSFGLATRLLGPRHRTHVRNIYALVRVADEIVDGVALEAGLSGAEQCAELDRYETETHRAMRSGYSSDLVIHAFARTARASGFGDDLTAPFFASMRADAHSGAGLDARAHARYVYGSAEVVGLMCLRVFLRDEEVEPPALTRIEHGARQLGAAFQNINFLRDLADDTDRLGRSYLSDDGPLDDAARDRWVATVRAQLSDAAETIPLLPRDARVAVRSAHALFAALTARVARTPAADLYRTRIRVPDPVKLGLAAGAVLTTLREGR